MKSPLHALVWFIALAVTVLAVWALVQWYTRPAPGTAGLSAIPAAQASPPTQAPSVMQPPPEPKDEGDKLFRLGHYDKALVYWEGAAAKGDTYAAYRLGVEYIDGKPGVTTRNPVKARTYHLQAAKAGEPRSMFDIGVIHEFGMGVPKDLSAAARWYRRSADYGHAQGQFNVATMLEAGEGVEKDPVEAYKYYALAADQGFRGVPYDYEKLKVDASKPDPLTILTAKLTKDQLDQGKARAAAFKVLTGPLASTD